MTVINTSPAIHLHAVLPGGIGLLPTIVGDVIVPHEVCLELAAGATIDSTWDDIQSLSGFHLRSAPVKIHPLLRAQIDLGEAAVIQTAVDGEHDTVILDDLKARRVATTLGLSITGTLGILLQAKLAGYLPSVSKAIHTLECRGMWIAPALVAKAKLLAGESAPD